MSGMLGTNSRKVSVIPSPSKILWKRYCRETHTDSLQRFRTCRQTYRKKSPDLAKDLQAALELLSEDALHPKLKTHKLKGDLEGSRAASVGYDLRIVFQMVDHEHSEAILLQTVGTHDEVY